MTPEDTRSVHFQKLLLVFIGCMEFRDIVVDEGDYWNSDGVVYVFYTDSGFIAWRFSMAGLRMVYGG